MELHIADASGRERNIDSLGSNGNVLLAHHAVGNALRHLRTAARNAGEPDHERYADSLIRYASETAHGIHRAEMALATCIERSTQSHCDTVCATCGVGFGCDCPCCEGH